MVVEQNPVVVKTYGGSQTSATARFRRDAEKMAADGYYPVSQSWAAGSYGTFDFLMALLFCVVLIGFVIFLYMLLVKPSGILTVTYNKQLTSNVENSATTSQEKVCPRCAEQVKLAAKVCRFCGHEFVPER